MVVLVLSILKLRELLLIEAYQLPPSELCTECKSLLVEQDWKA